MTIRPALSPRISIILPCHNADGRLTRTVQSVLSQTFGDFELIIIDDGSRDGSAGMARLLAVEDRRIRTLRQPRAGHPAAANRGIEAAQGEYLAFLAAGDIWSPRHLAQHLAHMDQAGECGVMLAEDGAAAGLFVHRAVFAEVGPFNIAAEGDAACEWTARVNALTDWEIHHANEAAPTPAGDAMPVARPALRSIVSVASVSAGLRALFVWSPPRKLLAG